MYLKKLKHDEEMIGKYLYYYFKIIGMATLTFSTDIKKSKRQEYLFTRSKFGAAYNVCLLIILTVSNYFSIKVIYIRCLYYSLSEVSQDISDFYSQPIMISVFNVFCSCICLSYYIIKPIALGRNWLSTHVVISDISKLALHSVCFVILTICIATTVNESKKTGRLVNGTIINCESLKIIEEIAGSITTYLVILLQFQ
ncbi:uncharacterized protein LOC131662726 [Phymastichus coffea]|uniref:uncharacterized protein LOC131662726 n=1 Tax=Phymastichus coffea TaxID=108790 RepID=UPI00273C5771|nr:uncharacterized protein LOC131662726 [Phymastichus coffea]